MSQIFVCVIKREKHTIPPAFLEQIAQLASRSDMYVFCPPKYIEEFMRTPKYGNLLVFDLADNDEYDDCEEFYYTVDCDLQNKRIETMVHIANYVLSEYSARDCAARPLKLSIHSGGIEHACRRR